MTEAEGQPQEILYGLRFIDLSNEILADIVDIYNGIAQVPLVPWRTPTVEGVERQLNGSSDAEFRMGSKFSPNSRLTIVKEYLTDGAWGETDRVVSFSFDPNIEILHKGLKKELEATKKQFKKAASDYLLQTGLGIALVPK